MSPGRNTTHGNGAGLRCGEGRNLFQAADQRSAEVSERVTGAGRSEGKKECVSDAEECDKK